MAFLYSCDTIKDPFIGIGLTLKFLDEIQMRSDIF